MRKIVICMDGTGNAVGDRETNVLKLYKSLDDDDTQITHYVMGVGTNDSKRMLGKLRQSIRSAVGLAFGLGLEDDVLDAYRFLCKTYQSAADKRVANPKVPADEFEDDYIYIFGFSRGAYAARMLAGFIHNFGIVEPRKLHLVGPVFRAYRRVTDSDSTADPDRVFQALREYERVMRPDKTVPIRFLGLYDTVSSMVRFRRIWHNLKTYGSLAELGTHANVDTNVSVRIISHALAIDERRSMFRAQVWNDTKTDYYGNRFRRDSAKRKQYVRQRWFPGFHSDIGGSPPEIDSGIGKLSLIWMLQSLKDAEQAADAEDADIAKATGDASLPGGDARTRGLTLRRSHMKRYIQGQDPSRQTPGGLPYAAPDPLAKIHPSIISGWMPKGSWIWLIFEILPKSIKRRATGTPKSYRRGLIWYLPLMEPRTIPDHHEIDQSAYIRRDGSAIDYDPPNLPPHPK